MSGLEVLIIVGAGVFITKKVRAHQKQKALKKLPAAGLLPQQHAVPQLVNQPQQSQLRRQQVPQDQEEALPLYSPPTKDVGRSLQTQEKSTPPTYDEIVTARNLPDSAHADQYITSHGNIQQSSLIMSTSEPIQSQSKRRKFWKTNSSKRAT